MEFLTNYGGEIMPKKQPMSKAAVRRIQSHADKTGENQGFKARAMRATDKKQSKK